MLQRCQTLFYQGMNTSQAQALKYVGSRKILATTGQRMWCDGKNSLPPLDIICDLHIGEEIADVNLNPYSTLEGMLNPINQIGAKITWVSNKFNGFQFSPYKTETGASVVFHAPILKQISVGQDTDIISHNKKYQSWLYDKSRTEGLILFGVSRGTAATFCAFSRYKYPEVKLVILEGAIDSVPNVLSNRMERKLGKHCLSKAITNVVSTGLSLFTQYKPSGVSPLSCVKDYPEGVPTVFITSAADNEVPQQNTENIANALAARQKNDVYLLTLKTSSHPNYMFDNREDRDTYEAFIHAIYKKYNLCHRRDLALKGENLVEANALFLLPSVKQIKTMALC